MSKLIGMILLAAYLQHQWLWVLSFVLEAAGVLAARTHPNHLLE
ncbi:hypothetical protein [Yersinia enterocolitica]|nr:hypothetical protein [Yersinia enterocolitica]MDA5484544.1 hypothetical protein [Yersinia enterocolitica]